MFHDAKVIELAAAEVSAAGSDAPAKVPTISAQNSNFSCQK
jgi:hypothetical protein